MGETAVNISSLPEVDLPPPPPEEEEPPPIIIPTSPDHPAKKGFKNIKEVKALMADFYNDKDTAVSTSMDILAVYMKSQKVLYTESKVYCEQQLNALMLPAIFISGLTSVLSPALQYYWAGVYVISSMAAVNSFLLAVISYLKLDAKAEAHKTSAYQFDKLQTVCEFNSGRVMFFKADKEEPEETKAKILKIVDEIEKSVKEIKDTNKFVPPQAIRFHYRELYDQNIFSDVKKVQIDEWRMLVDLKIAFNDIVELERKEPRPANYDMEITRLRTEKEVAIKNILDHRKRFAELDDKMRSEVDSKISKVRRQGCCACNWLKT